MPVDSPLIPSTAAAAATTTTTATTTASTSTAGVISRPSSRPISPIPQTHHLHYPPQPIYAAQPIPITTLNQFPKLHQDVSQGILYPLSSSGRGFVPRPPFRPFPVDQIVTVANSAGFPLRPVAGFPHRPAPPQLPPYPAPVAAFSSLKGVSNSSDLKVFPPSSVCESNGCKEMRDKVRDDTLFVVRDRKVRIIDGASLYALCRSWLRNGSQEESQPQYGNFLKPLPRPLPIPVASAIPSEKKEVVEEEDEVKEDKESIEHLSPQELLKRHVRRAKKVRSQLREERLQRIERYKTRLALLLPPPVEQLRTDNAAGI